MSFHHSSEEHLLPPPCIGLVVQLVSYWPPLTLLFLQVGEGILHPQNISAKKYKVKNMRGKISIPILQCKGKLHKAETLQL